jgi:hypothetical protein
MAYIGNVPAEKYTALTQQTFSTPTGTSFTLSQAVTNAVDIDLYIDNVKQDPTTYSVSGTALTTSTIASPSTMYCIYNGRAMQTVNPPDDSVGLAQLAGGTDGNIISYDASGNPVAIATGSDGQVLTSAGAGQPCAFETLTTGVVVQVVNVTDHTLSTTTATIPQDTSTPQNSEGLELFTLAITPTSASNKLVITADVNMASTGAIITRIVALFQDSTASALAVTGTASDTNNGPTAVHLSHYMTAGTTSSTTFKIRVGGNTTGTISVNGSNGTIIWNKCSSQITITEIAV